MGRCYLTNLKVFRAEKVNYQIIGRVRRSGGEKVNYEIIAFGDLGPRKINRRYAKDRSLSKYAVWGVGGQGIK